LKKHNKITNIKDSNQISKEMLIALNDCICHLECFVISIQPNLDQAHNILLCEIKRAFVKSTYWNGKIFAPTTLDIPPYLTFFGSQQFGYTRLT